MRVAIVHSFYTRNQPSGENAVVENSVKLLLQAGHDVRLFSRESDDLGKFGVVRSAVSVGLSRGGYEPWSEIVAWGADVVHVHNTFPNITTNRLKLIAQAGIRLVTTTHNYRPFCASATLSRPGKADCEDCVEGSRWSAVLHACYRDSRAATLPLSMSRRFEHDPLIEQSDIVICLTRAMKRKLIELNVAPERLLVIPNFEFEDASDEPQSFTPPNRRPDPFALFAGRLTAVSSRGGNAVVE